MIVVIQCAATKAPEAGHLVTAEGKPVTFVAHHEIAPKDDVFYARPDDLGSDGKSWRESLIEYNRKPQGNPLGLFPAYRLYQNPVYKRLVAKLGIRNVFILSAGWGLISSEFLTPYYDITFSPNARGEEAYKRRHKDDRYDDFRMLPHDTRDEILFFGGKDYVPLFSALTENVEGKRYVFHSAAQPPVAPGCELVKADTKAKTNWHYESVNALLDGSSIWNLSR
jgi:hypothetical protein